MNSIYQFSENRPEFKGFTRFYFDNIYPLLLSKEYERKRVNNKIRNAVILLLVVMAGLIAYIMLRTQKWQFALFVIFAGIPILFGIVYAMQKGLKSETKSHLMTQICGFLGWVYTEKDFQPPDMDVLRTNRLVPRYDRAKYEDQMSGMAHGAHFKFCEAHLEREDRDSDGDRDWVTVFRGVLLEIDFHRDFIGRTVVLRDGGFFKSKKFAGMKRVGLVDPKFEKAFEAYGTDQVEARYLLTPDFMQRLVDLETQLDGSKIQFGFLGGRLHITAQAPDQFEAGSLFKPLTDPQRTQKILNEIGAIFDVIDGVIKPIEKRV